MNDQLITKYSVAVPRYTSYPPANFFHEGFDSEYYKSVIVESNVDAPEHISIYIHMPFCFHICYYCGCNSQLFQGRGFTERYVKALKDEIKMVIPLLDKNRKISQIHYGGGTPSALPVATLKELNDLFLSEFETIDSPEIAIECHPGYLNEKYWHDLISAGFTRISLGIQDFDDKVLKASNRKAPLLSIEHVVEILKANHIPVNMDFIYGLPLQTVDSFRKTIEKALSMQPERIVTFSYAHVPWVNELQKKLEDIGLPTTEEKEAMYSTTKQILSSHGYGIVGLDHFVLPSDELFVASQDGELRRNFQGYCTSRTTGQVYAFGVTGISQLSNSYFQNTKDINTYLQSIEKGILPVWKGYELSREERITREVISELMCNYKIDWNQLADQFNTTVNDILSSINYDQNKLNEFAADGLIYFDESQLIMHSEARPFVRNVAASFDRLMLNTDKQFSKTL